MWAEKDSYVLKQASASESVKSSSLYFEFVLTKLYKENFTSFYVLWAPRQIVWGSRKNKKR